jgi:serine/threonine protein kinase/tetratricopeptide (TPR) repeat protein
MGSGEKHTGDPCREPSLKTGTVVSHYTIQAHLGTGGMSEVYLAEDTSLNRKVALKFPLPRLAADPNFRRRFQREAAGMAAINHPHVAVIHEIGVYCDRPFFAMEYIDGRTLQSVIDDALPSPDEAAVTALQICEGLAAIHDHGLIHRDVKPSNIMIDGASRARILDFGIATWSDHVDDTSTATVAGTPGYMSPEQIKGESLTPASDLFSLGVVLYQLLTGRKPFEGAYEAALKYAIINDSPVAINSIRPESPKALAEVVSRLLSKNPEDRYRDAGEAAARLREVVATSSQDVAVASQRRTGWRRVVTLMFSLAVIVAAVAIFIITRRGPDRTVSSTTVAVLPFKNLGSPEDEYFAEGLTDAVNTRLANIKGLRVISRGSSMQYGQSNRGWKRIGSELGVDYILTGTVFWDRHGTSNHVRANAQLIRVDDETYLWGDSYDRSLDEIFDLQSDIAGNVTDILRIATSEAARQSAVAVPTGNLKAYDFFLRGNYYFHRSWEQNDIVNATDMFQKAVELDSSFALAYAMLARGNESMFWEYHDRSEDRCREARTDAAKALSLDPNLVEGHLAQGFIYYHCDLDYNRALNEFTAGLNERPNCADLYCAVGAVQRRKGEFADAVGNYIKALELDPRSHLNAFDIALTYGLMRRFDRADAYLEKTLELAPDWPLPYVYKAWCQVFRSGDTEAARGIMAQAARRADIASSRYYWWLARIIEPDLNKVIAVSRPGPDTAEFLLHKARIYRLLGNSQDERQCADSAREILEREILVRPDDPRFQSHLGLAYAGLGDREKAIAHGQKALELLPASRDAFDALFLVVDYAEILVIFGDYDAAIDQLEYLMSIPGFVSPPYLHLDPIWKPLRDNPRFQKLLERSV